MGAVSKIWKGLLAGGAGVAALAAFNAAVARGREEPEEPSPGGETRVFASSFGRVFYRAAGPEGAVPLALLHGVGAGASSLAWRRNLAPLGAEFRVLAPDLLGFGLSDKPTAAPYSADFYVESIAEFLRGTAGDATPHVTGTHAIAHDAPPDAPDAHANSFGAHDNPAVAHPNSLGAHPNSFGLHTTSAGLQATPAGAHVVASGLTAAFAVCLAERHPRLVRTLTLVSPLLADAAGARADLPGAAFYGLLHSPVLGTSFFNAMTSERSIRDYARKQLYFDERLVTPRLVAELYALSHQPGAQYALSAYFGGYLNADARRAFARLRQPVALVWGRQDEANPVDRAVALLAANESARLKTFDRCRAMPQEEHAERFNALLRELLKVRPAA
jgi:pimeloyl-ACP methyl ester carboxylesterase